MNLRSAGRMGLPDRPSKHEAFLALLREGWTSLHLDARRAGVVVPAHLRGEGHLVLQYGNDLPIPIPDLEVDDFGVTATLSFARAPHQTVVPWSAVYVVASDDGRGVLYHEDVPPDVSVIARADGEPLPRAQDPNSQGPNSDDPGSEGKRPEGQLSGGQSSDDPLQPSDRVPVDIVPRPTPTRTLRAVPLVGPFEENATLDVMAASADPTLPARRRKRPLLRLVK